LITRESIYYINLRQAYALSPAYASRTSSRTVIFSSVPGDYLNVDKIRTMFGPEKVKNVWLATDTSKLEEKVKERDDVAMKLESAEIALIRAANGERLKSLKKGAHATEEEAHQTENPPEDHGDDESGSAAARWINTSKRPTHRLTLLIGKKVDTINWARSELERLNPEIEELQARHRAGNAKLVSSVFVEFYAQGDAQAAFQSGILTPSPRVHIINFPLTFFSSRPQLADAHEPAVHWPEAQSGSLVEPAHSVVGTGHTKRCDNIPRGGLDHILGHTRGSRRFHFEH
jgi:calcium permeable stress-gated cation channel